MNEFSAHLHSPGHDAWHRLDAAAQPVGRFQQHDVGEGMGQGAGCGQARHATPNNGDTDSGGVGWHSEKERAGEGQSADGCSPMPVRRLEALAATLAVGRGCVLRETGAASKIRRALLCRGV